MPGFARSVRYNPAARAELLDATNWYLERSVERLASLFAKWSTRYCEFRKRLKVFLRLATAAAVSFS